MLYFTGDFYLFSDGMLSDLRGTNYLLQVHNLIFFWLPQIIDLNAFEQLWKAYSIRILQNTVNILIPNILLYSYVKTGASNYYRIPASQRSQDA